MKFSNMNNNSRSKFQKYESAFDRKAKKAEQLRFRNTRERMELNSRSEDEYDEYEDDDNQEENLE
jgi:hypothetical protein